MTKVKICGIRTLEAAEVAVLNGADFLGFNFVPTSKRRIDVTLADVIIKQIRKSGTSIVGVFQNASVTEVNALIEKLGLDFVQLHGKEDSAYIQRMNVPVIKSFTLSDDPATIEAEYLILDREERGKGDMVDLVRAEDIARQFKIFLAGGLTPQIVAEAVRSVRPYAVDVAGGVETDGVQDTLKISSFIEHAKKYD